MHGVATPELSCVRVRTENSPKVLFNGPFEAVCGEGGEIADYDAPNGRRRRPSRCALSTPTGGQRLLGRLLTPRRRRLLLAVRT